jgi:MFS family permease
VEFLPVRNRGKVIVLVLIVQAIGACITGGLAWWLIPTYVENGWRYLIIATTIPQLFCAVYRLFIFPLQSPRFLIAKGRYKEANKVFKKMAWLNRKNVDDILPKGVKLDVSQADIGAERKAHICVQFWKSVASIFKPPYLRMTVPISLIYVTSSTAYVCSSIFLLQVLKEFGTDPYFTSFTGYLGQIPGILLMSIIVEWKGVGRINSLRFFTVITVAAFLLLAFVRNQVATSVLTVFLYFGMVPQLSLLYTYMSEIYPTAIRSTAIVFNNNLAAAIGIAVPYFSGFLSQVSIPWLYPTVWAAFYSFQFVLTFLLRHETLGLNLRDTT